VQNQGLAIPGKLRRFEKRDLMSFALKDSSGTATSGSASDDKDGSLLGLDDQSIRAILAAKKSDRRTTSAVDIEDKVNSRREV